MSKQIVLTGITTTGIPHLGNYAGAIRPAIETALKDDVESYYFMADYHALIKCHDPVRVQESTKAIAATWLACGLDPEKVFFYRQSNIPEILELNWLLTCVTAKGLMNRAHAYKAAVQENVDSDDVDPDKGITMGLFSYPILMSADILMFNAHKVPVGKDQIQHLEMCRDIAARFNHIFGETFNLPEVVVQENSMVLPGLDGRKMSKSYNNTIPLFEDEKKFRKLINKIVTNSLEPGEPKDPDGCNLFAIFSAFATPAEIAAKRQQYADGIGWGDAKKQLFEYLNEMLAEKRQTYNELMANPDYIESTLKKGEAKAREKAAVLLAKAKKAVGIAPIY
ncbi:tryptophan--tRNA ligase [Gynuella sunshinyii]|uniref:Tryptophan--tRNA ligase n=1 Tax=Gynuella sunshinyii YC6258 TaxID=1445510 RepID=A0A0C5VI14_9GAMM|nr:tryptophan--tRNA ligase [Gynuella sunshinyii]AJQ94282.1 tryptophanyl-tRNA synthetase [Gynuella sunshinyii YC6258]